MGDIADHKFTASDKTIPMGMLTTFDDLDGGELTYMSTSSDPAVATTGASDSQLIVTLLAAGMTTIMVTTTDPEGMSSTEFILPVEVEPAPMETVVWPYPFDGVGEITVSYLANSFRRWRDYKQGQKFPI